MPVVTVDDVGMLAALEHELQRGATEEGEALVVVHLTVESAAVEETCPWCGSMKKHLRPWTKPKNTVQ